MVRYLALKNYYELDKTIGSGGFAKVKLAYHLATGEKVAIKIMEKISLGDDLPRVKTELEALKSVTHHHICKLYEVIETTTHVFMVMEYCSGGELFDHIVEQSRLSEEESRTFFQQILSAIAYLHSLGYAHRDIKPENILLDKDKNLKLIDFGLCAKPKGGMQSPLLTSCGSPSYAAPELINGFKYYGAEVDVWSMGVLLYALLCGSLPFDSENIDALYKKILSGNYEEPNFLSNESRQIIRQMLEVDPTKRITVKSLLNHPWIQTSDNYGVFAESLNELKVRDEECVNVMATHYNLSINEMWERINKFNFDYNYATYQLLLTRKQQGLPLRLLPKKQYGRNGIKKHKELTLNSTSPNFENQKRTPIRGNDIEAKQKEGFCMMEPPCQTPQSRKPQKRLHCTGPEDIFSPIPAKISPCAVVNRTCTLNTASAKFSPKLPAQYMSPSSKLLGSIEKRMNKVRKVLTPRRCGKSNSLDILQPTVLAGKSLCNVSTTSSKNPDHVLQQLTKVLNCKGIICKNKGYTLRGKFEPNVNYLIGTAKPCKLSFELEVCLIPCSGDNSAFLVGIRRKRLKGDAWCYKRICEEVLNMADMS
uniref:non-specific serine/threonine protein kinase n=1 Tax=Clastoptera arizonana TaxID=38151 RepID=A0A1B6E9A5_9HEMI